MPAGPTLISIDAFPESGQRHAWGGALDTMGLRVEMAAGAAPSGDVGMMRSPGGALLARLRSTPQKLDNPAPETAMRRAAPVLVIFHHLGRGDISGREFAEGDVSVVDRAEAFTLNLCEDFEILVLEIPRKRLLSRLGRAMVRLPAVLGATVAAAALRPALRALALNFEAAKSADLSAAEIAVTELITGALLGEARLKEEGATHVQTAHFRRVTSAIELRLGDPELGMADIAAQEAMSQRYLQKLFELQDTTFSAYTRQRRLDRARLDLADPARSMESVADIAFRWGFRDPAHFSRVFSAEFGVSPRAFRNSGAVGPVAYPLRGRPMEKSLPHNAIVTPLPCSPERAAEWREQVAAAEARSERPRIRVDKDKVHWGYLSRVIPPVLSVASGTEVVIETLTQHAYDDYERMIKGDAGAESVFHWTRGQKNVERRGAGPVNASIFGRGAGEGFGVHIFTGPVYIQDAEPGDILEVNILDIVPRPSRNPDYAGRSFASNVSAWWGYQYTDMLDAPKPREVATIYEAFPEEGVARAVYSYHWTPQVDPFGIRHDTMDYPGVPVDRASIEERHGILQGVTVPLRPHFGCMAVAPREAEIVDSIPPGYFGGNIDNWRAGKGATLYLPVAVPGALFSVGDGHLAQGDGELNGTGLEASLTGTFRFTVHKKQTVKKPFLKGLNSPLIETPEEFVLHGFSYPNYLRDLGRNAQSEVYKKSSLSKALRAAFRASRKFLMETYGLSEDEAVSLISVGVDFGVTQVADGNWGVHAVIRKGIFADRASA